MLCYLQSIGKVYSHTKQAGFHNECALVELSYYVNEERKLKKNEWKMVIKQGEGGNGAVFLSAPCVTQKLSKVPDLLPPL